MSIFVRPRKGSYTEHSRDSDGAKSHSRHKERKHSTGEFGETERLKRHNSEPTKLHSDRKDSAVSNRDLAFNTIEEEARDIVVKPGDLQATFENLRCVIKEKGEVALSSSTVTGMLESIYDWMVFDKNLQITIPSEPGSTTVQKMWPQGSRIDTRKKKDRSVVESSSRRLKDVDGDYASTVASSVISSTMEEEGMKMKKGTIMYPERICSTPIGYGQQHQYHEYSRALPIHSSSYSNRDYDQAVVGPPMQRAAAQTFAPVPQQNRSGPRYSIIGPALDPPQRVQETPQPEPAQPVRRRVRKPKVGVSSRPTNGEDEGTDILFAD